MEPGDPIRMKSPLTFMEAIAMDIGIVLTGGLEVIGDTHITMVMVGVTLITGGSDIMVGDTHIMVIMAIGMVTIITITAMDIITIMLIIEEDEILPMPIADMHHVEEQTLTLVGILIPDWRAIEEAHLITIRPEDQMDIQFLQEEIM